MLKLVTSLSNHVYILKTKLYKQLIIVFFKVAIAYIYY